MRIITTGGSASRPYLYLPDGWDSGWQSAKAAKGSTPAWVAFIGDSISAGLNSSDYMLKSFPALVRAGLLNGDTPYADFYGAAYSSGTNAPFAFTNDSLGSGGFNSLATSTGTTMTATITSPYACTAMDLWTRQSYAGTWKYAVDGGTTQTVTNSTSDFFLTRIALTGLSAATHTISCNTPSGANVLAIAGASFYPNGSAATGLGFAFSGFSGQRSTFFAYSASYPFVEGWAGRTSHGGATYSPVFPQGPHLAIIELGVNDCSNASAGPGQYQHMIRGLVEQLRRGRPGCSVLLVMPCYPNPDSSDTTNSLGNPRSWQYYLDAAYAVAADKNCAVANLHAKWAETPQGSGFIASGSNVHPTDAGHADIADLLLEIL